MYSIPVYIPNTLRRLSEGAKMWADWGILLPAPTLCLTADGPARVNQQRTIPAQYRCIVNSLIKYVAQERCRIGCLVIVTYKSWRPGMFSLAQASARGPLCSVDQPPRAWGAGCHDDSEDRGALFHLLHDSTVCSLLWYPQHSQWYVDRGSIPPFHK
jgi:hypothetical protein